ncbi:MAG TPA: polyphosphate kinase 1 [Terriglobales bacterium]|nr:polyphosphate kinase 1 [Terriglobales bacterium]
MPLLNRELSWLAFNQRVLEEAHSETNPLLERVKFLAITASNLDEFLEIRVAGLLQQIEEGVAEPGPDGLTPVEIREAIVPRLQAFSEEQYRCWNQQLRPQLALVGVQTLALQELLPKARRFVQAFCQHELDPLLTPITIDPAHPFPRVVNKALCLAFLLRRKGRRGQRLLGVVTVPRALPRLIRLPGKGAEYVHLAHLVGAHAKAMYRGLVIEATAAFRVTRNSNLYLREEESRNLLETVRLELHNRRKGTAVRLEIERGANPEIVERLRANFELEPWQVFFTDGPVNLGRLISLYEQTQRPELKFTPFTPPRPMAGSLETPRAERAPAAASQSPPTSDHRERPNEQWRATVFQALRTGDQLWHHPFDSYAGVVGFIEQGANDPRVLSIKQTLYRTSPDSLVLKALIAAAAHKEVAVVVELKARFDEAANMAWARQLEDAGVQVFFGAVGRKTHAKMALLVRQDEDGALRRYLHLGTGNYNHRTARQYTDFSLLTARPELGAAAHAVFGYLTAGTAPAGPLPLLVAPLDLAPRLQLLVRREAEQARRGKPARIIAKMNGLQDRALIESLYAASEAGVEIDLIVRGICALRPGVRGLSRRIRVRSIIGRFLEHSRAFYFYHGGAEEIYVGSADWMPRNLYERTEVVFPILDGGLRQRLRHEVLAAYLADGEKTWFLQSDGSYRRPRANGFSAQAFLMARSLGRVEIAEIPAEVRR